MNAVKERWEILERIGAYAAGELSGEEAREAERLVLINAAVRYPLEDHRRRDARGAPAVIDHAIRQALAKKKAGACQRHTEHTEKGKTPCTKGRPKQ